MFTVISIILYPNPKPKKKTQNPTKTLLCLMSEIRKSWVKVSDESGFLMFWPETDDNFTFIQTSSSSTGLIH